MYSLNIITNIIKYSLKFSNRNYFFDVINMWQHYFSMETYLPYTEEVNTFIIVLHCLTFSACSFFVRLSWRNAPGTTLTAHSFLGNTSTPLSQEGNIGSSNTRQLHLKSKFLPPTGQSCEPARPNVMVSVTAWLLLALGAGYYYPAGCRFITATLPSSTNFDLSESRRKIQRLPK